ncbi:PTS sugar transporter subunit IIA [Geoalkalibacter subterraneus]|uniref:PTS fructose transporter subunit IIA n=1 Tax=Geoalkalibacter subterraneus TaxID=483547 RepID=A0A0B5FDE2_9BACT|nr:PTS sugar transporter subunit IIA [Geoalkalibacter subterraneus]AJF05323.1 PTS fructose transporter subunit IIA [Geoalkalibacter subterraneus]
MNTSVKEAAELLRVSEKTIYRWIKQEILPVYKVNEQYRFNRAELLEWATSRRMGISPEAFHEPEASGAALPTLFESLETGGIVYRLDGNTRKTVLARLVDELRLPEEVDREYLLKVLNAREQLASTGVGGGIAIPHPRNPVLLHITKPSVTLAFLEKPVDFHALDGKPVHTLFCLISPTLRAHLHLLSVLSFALRDPGFRAAIENQASREEIFSTLKRVTEELSGPSTP